MAQAPAGFFIFEEFVLRRGRQFAAMPRLADVPQLTRRWCFRNAWLLVLTRNDVTYAEGYCLAKNADLFEHGWVVTNAGVALDPSIDASEIQDYQGVVYDRERYLEWTRRCGGCEGILWTEGACKQRVRDALKRGEAPVELAS